MKKTILCISSICLFLIWSIALQAAGPTPKVQRPNVVLIMTDDQGYGDMGVHGNPVIKTPNLDKFADQSVEIDPFYVSPVCSPTRASLMTGRFNYRTGVVDTFMGRSMMNTEEVTIAEVLRDAGYRTAIFGKWHLGDCYPMRPIDQGFEEALTFRGGILGPNSFPPDNGYFDPLLQHNGKDLKTKGYCTDVFTDAAIDYITKHHNEAFFAYIPYNCPHSPFQIAEKYSQPYETLKMKPDDFPDDGDQLAKVPPHTAKVYGMVSNIDENLGRLFKTLDDLGLSENTIVIFLTDNGPNGSRYNAGMRGYKGSSLEGGIRTAFFIRWPAELKAGYKVNQVAAHIDVLPTILEACGVKVPDKVRLDGRSFLPLIKGRQDAEWPDRTLFFQWHRGDEPVPYLGFAARSHRYKLLYGGKVWGGSEVYMSAPPRGGMESLKPIPFELYDLEQDPLEAKNIAQQAPEILSRMRKDYDAWLADVGRERGYAPPAILVGTRHENPMLLTNQDQHEPDAASKSKEPHVKYWTISAPDGGVFDICCYMPMTQSPATAHLSFGEVELSREIPVGAERCVFSGVKLEAGLTDRLQVWIVRENKQERNVPRYVSINRIDGTAL